MYRRFLIIILLLTVFLAGCQWPGGKPSGAREGYFTWVDEQGQVRQTVIPSDESSAENEGRADTHHSEFNLQNYPDGDSLAARGHIRPGDPEPYFTWRDAQGNLRVSYYQPDARTAVEKGKIRPPLELTEASIYQASDVSSIDASSIDASSINRTEGASLPDGADAMAAVILGLDEREAPFFERWTGVCCETLDRSAHIDWESGREFGVNVEETSPSHDFITGDSHYRLVRLPATDDFIMRLRSFDRQGVFVPSIAFLDDEFRPLRLVTDLVAEFVPESWRQHGYLRSYIPVFPSRGERWLLIHTTTEDTDSQTVIDTRHGPRAIAHQPTGQLGLVKWGW